MRSIVYARPGVKIVDAPEPQISSPCDVKIKIAYSSVCGSDLHIVKGELDHFLGDVTQVPVYPLGHESVGTVVELGAEATSKGLKIGDAVTFYYNQHCGDCYYCRNGQEQFCSAMKVNMASMADYLVVNEQQVYKLPDSVDLPRGVWVEPISVCLHAIDLTRMRPGARVAISGGGGMGLILMQLSRLSGATKLTVIEPLANKRELALELGADFVIDPVAQDVKEEGMRITGGLGYDVVIEASGSTKACQADYDLVAKGGTLEFYAALYDPQYSFPLNLFDAFWKEINIVSGVFQSPYTFPRSIALLERLNLEPITNAIFPVEEVEAAFDAQIKGECVKAILKF